MFIEEYARGYIYRLTFRNGKVYIGLTERPFEERLKEHRWAAKRVKTKLYNGWRKHGDPIAAEVIFVCRLRDLYEFEIQFIAEYDSHRNGYNSTKGGDESPAKSPESRAKQRAIWMNSDFISRISATSEGQDDLRLVRHQVSVRVHGRRLGIFRSTLAAFLELGLPVGVHSDFRLRLKAAHKENGGPAVLDHGGKEYVFRIISYRPGAATKRIAEDAASPEERAADDERAAQLNKLAQEESRKRKSETSSTTMKGQWADPNAREARMAAYDAVWSNPERRALASCNMSAAREADWSDAEFRARMMAARDVNTRAVSVEIHGAALGTYPSTRKAFATIGLPEVKHQAFRKKLKAAHRANGSPLSFIAANGDEYVFRIVDSKAA